MIKINLNNNYELKICLSYMTYNSKIIPYEFLKDSYLISHVDIPTVIINKQNVKDTIKQHIKTQLNSKMLGKDFCRDFDFLKLHNGHMASTTFRYLGGNVNVNVYLRKK